LTQLKAADLADFKLPSSMANIIFKCPRTGLNVQHWLEDDPTPDNPSSGYESVTCSACRGLHFLNRSNGKLVGEREQ
jgi:hypothetical protein